MLALPRLQPGLDHLATPVEAPDRYVTLGRRHLLEALVADPAAQLGERPLTADLEDLDHVLGVDVVGLESEGLAQLETLAPPVGADLVGEPGRVAGDHRRRTREILTPRPVARGRHAHAEQAGHSREADQRALKGGTRRLGVIGSGPLRRLLPALCGEDLLARHRHRLPDRPGGDEPRPVEFAGVLADEGVVLLPTLARRLALEPEAQAGQVVLGRLVAQPWARARGRPRRTLAVARPRAASPAVLTSQTSTFSRRQS